MTNKTKKAITKLSKKAGIKSKGDKKNPFKKLHYSTDHLPLFHEFSSLIGLYGRHYIPLIKTRYYQLIGGILQKPIQIGNLRTDSRVHAVYPLVTEGGKNELIYILKDLVSNSILKFDKGNFKISEPISYSPESLVGKYIEITEEYEGPRGGKRKRKVRVENRGHLDNDFLEFDECTSLITGDSPESKQAREYLSKSENPIGRNTVEKRLVDDRSNEVVSYKPKCTCSYYFQPYGKIPEKAFLQGFLRRVLIPVGNVNYFLNFADEGLFKEKLESLNFSTTEYRQRVIRHLEKVLACVGKMEFSFTEKAREMIKDYALFLSAQGQIHSEKMENYSKLTKFTTLSNLVKMSCIVSASYYQSTVDENAVSLAFMDLVEILQNTLDFIYMKTKGDFSYGTSWGGANYKQREVLKWLYSEKAFSVESSDVSISQFLVKIGEVFNVKESQARNRYLEMKKANLVDSDQVGKTETKVWLKIKPDEHKKYIEGDKGYKGYTLYNNVYTTRNTIIKALQSLTPLKP